MESEVRSILVLDTDSEWETPIVLTDAITGEGVEELWDAVGAHRSHLEETGLLAKRRASNLARQVYALASGRAKAHLERAVAGDAELRRLLELVEGRELDPLSAVREIMQKVFRIEP
jgi:LAO/AO transport system kinase